MDADRNDLLRMIGEAHHSVFPHHGTSLPEFRLCDMTQEIRRLRAERDEARAKVEELEAEYEFGVLARDAMRKSAAKLEAALRDALNLLTDLGMGGSDTAERIYEMLASPSEAAHSVGARDA